MLHQLHALTKFLLTVYDPCVYLKNVLDVVFGFIILVLYVNDMLLQLPKDPMFIF